MAKIDLDGDGKADFSINFTQIIAVATLFASIIGSYYTLNTKIDKAMAMPKQEVSAKDIDALKIEYNLKIEKVAVQAKENMVDIKEIERNFKRK